MRTLKLMADYGCFPLWEASPGVVGNVNPESLPISQSLKADLASWAEAYDKTLNADDPMSSGFESDRDEERFKREGRLLAERLQAELGFGYTVKVNI